MPTHTTWLRSSRLSLSSRTAPFATHGRRQAVAASNSAAMTAGVSAPVRRGIFPSLPARLRPKSLAVLGPAFGTAQVLYQRRGPGSPRSTILHTAGALQRPPADPPVTADPPDSWVTTEVAALT